MGNFKGKKFPKAKEDFELTRGVNGQVELATGELTTTFENLDVGDKTMPLIVSHTHKKSEEDLGCGQSFRLSLHQRLDGIIMENSNDILSYVYTDDMGEKHTFIECFFYEDCNGSKQRILKSQVLVAIDGKMTITVNGQTYEVERKFECDTMNAHLSTRIKDLRGVRFLEQRDEEEREFDEQIKNFEENLRDIVAIDGATLNIDNDNFSKYNLNDDNSTNDLEAKAKSFLIGFRRNTFGADPVVMDKSGVLQLENLITQRRNLDRQKEIFETQRISLITQNNLLETQHDSLEIQWNTLDAQHDAFGTQIDSLKTQKTALANQNVGLTAQDSALEIQYRMLAAQRRGLESQSSLLNLQMTSLQQEYNRLDKTVSCPYCTVLTATFSGEVTNVPSLYTNLRNRAAQEAPIGTSSGSNFRYKGGVNDNTTDTLSASSTYRLHRCSSCGTYYTTMSSNLSSQKTEMNNQRDLIGTHTSATTTYAGGSSSVNTQAKIISDQQTNIGSSNTALNSQRNAIRLQKEDLGIQQQDIDNQITDLETQQEDIRTQQENICTQKTDIRTQQGDITRQQTDISNQSSDILAQLANISAQFDLLIKQGRRSLPIIKDMIVNYVNTLEQQRQYIRQSPQAVLISEEIILGFGADGRLNTIFNGDKNYTSIVWDEIETCNGKKSRLTSIEVNDKTTKLEYNRDGLLASLTCHNGDRMLYSYNNNSLIKVEFCGLDEELLFEYDNCNIIKVKNTYTKTTSVMSYDGERLTGISNQSYAEIIGDTEVIMLEEPKELMKTNITYITQNDDDASNIIIDIDGDTSHYYLNYDGSLAGKFVKYKDGSFKEKPSFNLTLNSDTADTEMRGRLWEYSVAESDGFNAIENNCSITTLAQYGGLTEFVVSAEATLGGNCEELERPFCVPFRSEPQINNPNSYGISVQISYESSVQKFIGSFDSRISGRQLLMLPITIDKTKRFNNIEITTFAPNNVYSDLIGEIRFAPAEWSYTEYNEWDNENYNESSEQLIAESENSFTYSKSAIGIRQSLIVNGAQVTPINTLNSAAKEFDCLKRPVKEQTTNRTIKIDAVNKSIIETKDTHVISVKVYDDDGDVIRQENWVLGEESANGKNIEEVVYDDDGNLIEQISYNSLDPSSKFIKKSEYNDAGQVETEYDETGENKTEFEYENGTNRIRTSQTANGSKFGYGYDRRGAIAGITQSTQEGEGNATKTRYVAGLPTRLSAGRNTLTSEYDYKGRRVKVSLNGQEKIRYEYEEHRNNSNMGIVTILGQPFTGIDGGEIERKILTAAKQSATGEVVDITGETWTDERSRLRMIGINGEVQIAHTYNDDNTVSQTGDGVTGSITNYSYNAVTKKITKIASDAGITAAVPAIEEVFSYTDHGEVYSRTVKSGGTESLYQYIYKDNAAKDLESIILPNGLSLKSEADINGRNCAKEISGVGGEKIAGEYVTYRKYGINATNTVASIRYGARRNNEYVIKDGLNYKYDEQGNISEIRENGQLTIKYTYDKLNRLIREDNAALNKTVLLTYDNNGNILSKREGGFSLRENSDRLEIKNISEYEYSGDNGDLLKSIIVKIGEVETIDYNETGNPLLYKGNAVEWKKGRIVKFGNINFTYDGQGRRIEKTILGGDSKNYIYDSNGYLIRQITKSGNPETADVIIDFVREGADLIGLTYNGAHYLYRKNLNGDITCILDSYGKIVVKYSYDAWGNHTVSAIQGYDVLARANPYRYRNYIYDTEINLYCTHLRYYDPKTGRFISADSIENAENQIEYINGLNLYTFCANNPNSYIDPDGGSFTVAAYLLGLLIAGLISAATYGLIEMAIQVFNGKDFSSLNWAKIGVAALEGFVIGVAFKAYGAIALAKKGMAKAMLSSGVIAANAKAAKAAAVTTSKATAAAKTQAAAKATATAQSKQQVAKVKAGLMTKGQAKKLTIDAIGKKQYKLALKREFQSHKQLTDFLGPAGNGKHWHHVVEKNQVYKSGFAKTKVHSVKNVVPLKGGKGSAHARISGYYSSGKGMRVRELLIGKSFRQQFRYGLGVLRKFGGL